MAVQSLSESKSKIGRELVAESDRSGGASKNGMKKARKQQSLGLA